jgi:soluble lytic murein transglycosylase
MLQVDRLGIYLSKPISVLLVLIYLLQSGLLILLIRDRFDLQRQISFQQRRITELEERLEILKAIEDFQIGFTDEEVLELTNVVYEESRKYRYDPMFVLAIILTESSFKRRQTSSAGAEGLMQLMPWVGRDLARKYGLDHGDEDFLFDPQTNIQLGTAHLFRQILKFGDVEKAIVAYNVGETRLRGLIRKGKRIPQRYLEKVVENYKKLKEEYSA